ncbi:hypothetical protein [Pseudolysinimonas sp.]|uniref:hypothetical protein n=1 Tax=Pseudolysinimonas sp. TaxID=2680009 RepID=UPI003F7E59C5
MSLIDRTNEDIALSMRRHRYDSGKGTLNVDVDRDSSVWPEPWIYLSLVDDSHDAEPIYLTLDEAAKLHDRLGRILGLREHAPIAFDDVRDVVHIYQAEWEKPHPVVEPDASAAEQLESQFRFRVARRILEAGYRKVLP